MEGRRQKNPRVFEKISVNNECTKKVFYDKI